MQVDPLSMSQSDLDKVPLVVDRFSPATEAVERPPAEFAVPEGLDEPPTGVLRVGDAAALHRLQAMGERSEERLGVLQRRVGW